MIYLQVEGRLGNQMFQYAFARSLQEKSQEEIVLDFSKFDSRDVSQGWENQLKYFHTNFKEQRGVKLSWIQRRVLHLYSKEKKKKSRNRLEEHYFEIKWSKLLNFFGIYLLTQGYCPFSEKTFFSNKYVEGYFESSQYFQQIREQLVKEFTPKYPPLEENKKLYQIAADTESICVTVRRGDSVSDNSIQKFVDICSVDYFLEGVQIIRKKLNTNNLSVIVFSDDVDWCRENIRFEGISNVFYESGNDPIWEKIRMMYSCKHFVISNSSFSWWAQYLSRNENKIVVAPSKWRNYENAMDIYESGWILVDVDHISEHKVYERR